MPISTLNLDSVLLLLHNSKLATRRNLEHNLLKHNLGQKLNVIKDADIFSFMFGVFYILNLPAYGRS